MRRNRALTLLLALFALPLAGCGDDPGRPGRPDTEILERYGDDDDPDQMVLDQLVGAGGDLSKATNVRWYVYFPSNRSAEAFAALAREAAWQVDRRPAQDGVPAVCLCSRRVAPALEAIRAMRAELQALGQGLEPDIDGWEAALQK